MAQPLYSTSVQIPVFAGLNQSGDGFNKSMQYAVEMENVSVEGGSFKPMRQGLMMQQELVAPIGTLAYLHRRFGDDTGTLLVAISDGRVFTKLLDGDDEWVQRYPALVPPEPEESEEESEEETEEETEEELVEADDPLEVSDCDWVTYEVNERDDTPLANPVDVLLFTNATDGMFCLYGDTLEVVPVEVAGGVKFGVLARYNERIWGSGIDGDPDKLMYSAPYDPFDWEANTEIPEDGAGDILQPTWDGDSFVALRQYGSTLLAIKRNSVWRIYGTDPGEFTMTQQYGGGAIEENTVAVYNDQAFMLGEYGMLRYEGTGAYPFLQEEIQTIMHDMVNHEALSVSCAGMRNGTYCLALPINGSEFCNAVLEYNVNERSLALRTLVNVDSFLQINERLFYTSASYPGRVFEMRDDMGTILPCLWVSGYQDLGLKSSIKSAFTLYMMVESEAPAELRVGIRTEKKLKQKIINTKPGKMTRLHLNTQGRIFRLEIRSYSAVPFTIAGGAKLDLELDPD